MSPRNRFEQLRERQDVAITLMVARDGDGAASTLLCPGAPVPCGCGDFNPAPPLVDARRAAMDKIKAPASCAIPTIAGGTDGRRRTVPKFDVSRGGQSLAVWVITAFSAGGIAVSPAASLTLRPPLTCTFKTVQAGQFDGLDFASGPTGGITTLTIAASPLDLRLKRVALIEDAQARLADVVSDTPFTTLVSYDAASTIVVSLFGSSGQDESLAATMSRHQLIGAIPVVVYAVGACTQGQPTDPR